MPTNVYFFGTSVAHEDETLRTELYTHMEGKTVYAPYIGRLCTSSRILEARKAQHIMGDGSASACSRLAFSLMGSEAEWWLIVFMSVMICSGATESHTSIRPAIERTSVLVLVILQLDRCCSA